MNIENIDEAIQTFSLNRPPDAVTNALLDILDALNLRVDALENRVIKIVDIQLVQNNLKPITKTKTTKPKR